MSLGHHVVVPQASPYYCGIFALSLEPHRNGWLRRGLGHHVTVFHRLRIIFHFVHGFFLPFFINLFWLIKKKKRPYQVPTLFHSYYCRGLHQTCLKLVMFFLPLLATFFFSSLLRSKYYLSRLFTKKNYLESNEIWMDNALHV